MPAKNREAMLQLYQDVLRRFRPDVGFADAVQCHHNYVAEEVHFGQEVLVTRKGAIRAGKGELGINPRVDGYPVVRSPWPGEPGQLRERLPRRRRRMSRSEAKRRYSVKDLRDQTQGVECRKTGASWTRSPLPTKTSPGDGAAAHLVEVVAELRQVLCVKG